MKAIIAFVLLLFTLPASADFILLNPPTPPTGYSFEAAEGQAFDSNQNVTGVCVWSKRVVVGRIARVLRIADVCVWDQTGTLISATLCTLGIDCWRKAPTVAVEPGPFIVAVNIDGLGVGYRWRNACTLTGPVTNPTLCNPIGITWTTASGYVDIPALIDKGPSYAFNVSDSGVIIGTVDSLGFIYR